MIILGIETSCDETACAILKKDGYGVHILSNIVASSANLQAKYGGVIPEQAAREQIKSIIPVIEKSIQVSGYRQQELDAIAVTYGPGLIGSLLVGVETAKTLAIIWDKPLIPINHLIGHFYANWISPAHLRGAKTHPEDVTSPSFPCLGLLVSGGHTDLVLFENHGQYEYLGGTRDDASGECFDKCARLLGLPYPGGPAIAKLAERGNPRAYNLPRPMINSKDFDFSFSGLKTAVVNLLHTFPIIVSPGIYPSVVSLPQDNRKTPQNNKALADLAASIEQAIADVLVTKTIKAAQTYHIEQIIVAGGVAANQKLVSDFKLRIENGKLKIKLHVPPANLCTDNAAVIAASAFFNYYPIDPLTLQVDPNLSLS